MRIPSAVLHREAVHRGTHDHLSVRCETRPVQGAVPALIGIVPAHDSAQVGADRTAHPTVPSTSLTASGGAGLDAPRPTGRD